MRNFTFFKTLLMAFMLMGGVNCTWADETIGNVDEGWVSHYKTYTLAPGKSLTISFTVDETKKTQDYQGWITKVRKGETQVFFMQPSGGYWGTDGQWWTGATYAENNYDWTETDGKHEKLWNNFQGASVVYNIKRVGNDIILSEDVTTTSTAPSPSTKFRHYFVFPYESSEDFSIDFGADAAVLTIKEVTTTDAAVPTTYGTLVGASNNTTGWWSAFSDYYSVAANETKTVYFRNYSNKLQNYFNWIIGLTNDVDRGGVGYTEHAVLRADNFLIQNPHSGTLTSAYNWSTFKDELDGALVKMTVTRSGSTVTVTAKQIAATDQSTIRPETYSFTDETSASDAMRFFLTTEGGHLDILPEYTITLTRNNDSYGTAAVTATAFNDGVVPAGTSVTITATPADGYVFNGWKNGEEYVSRNSTYTFTVTANTSLQAEFVAIKTSWDFKTASWAKESGFDNSKSVTINTTSCTYANGDLAGLAFQGGSETAWTINGNGLTQGNGPRNIGILNCTAGQLVTIHTGTTLSAPVNGTLIGTATTGTVYYRVTADGTFGFKEERNNYITSIAVTAMDYTILYAADKAVYDTKVASLDATGQAYWEANVTAASSVTDEDKYNTAVAALPTVYRAAVKAQTSPNSNMTDAIPNASCTAAGSWSGSVDNTPVLNTWSTEANTGMNVNFMQYWVAKGETLAANTMSQTITDLQNGTYRVSATVRLWDDNTSSTETEISGASLIANSEEVAISGARATHAYTNYTATYYTSTPQVEVQVTDGTLTIGVKTYAEKISWVAFKNFTLTLVRLASVSATFGTNGYTTFASPYALDLTTANLPFGVKAYKASVEGNTVTFSELNQTVPANTGVLLEGTASASVSIPVVAEGTTVSENDFKVNIAGTTFDAESGYTYFGLVKDSNPLKFGVFAPGTVAIPADKAYLQVADAVGAKLVVRFDSDESSAIEGVRQDVVNNGYYNLAGQRVAQPTKGLYIVNGKKVFVK